MITGDAREVAESVAAEVGVDEVKAEVLPEDKAGAVAELQRRGLQVAMVGDGVNDAPALATASVGIAMGGAGTDVALDTADVVLMRDDLRGIAFSLWLARRARRVVAQSLTLAFSVIGVLVVSTISGILPLWLAVVCHEGSTLVVIANGVRLLRMPHPQFELAAPGADVAAPVAGGRAGAAGIWRAEPEATPRALPGAPHPQPREADRGKESETASRP
jgi:Cd2+/Zn2+-exporting ATPase